MKMQLYNYISYELKKIKKNGEKEYEVKPIKIIPCKKIMTEKELSELISILEKPIFFIKENEQ